ncbi:MAG: TolB family protein [Gemmatimonadota bacterium]
MGVIDADGSNERILASDGAAYPAWMPDGRLSFVRDGDFWAVGVDGSGESLLIDRASVGPWIWSADWSPDGASLAVGNGAILTGSVGDSDLRRRDYGFEPDWTPDGQRLVYNRGAAPGCKISSCAHRIFIVDMLGNARKLVPDAVAPVNAQYSDYAAVWSEKGSD